MIKTPEAKQLCTKTEFQLFAESQARPAQALSEAELRKRVKRSRTARDKYRALAERQRREARGKQKPRASRPSKSAQRTVRKQQLFDETLSRYQERLSAVRGKSTRAAAPKKGAKKATKKPAKKAAKKRTAAKRKSANPKQKPSSTKRNKKKATKKKTRPSKKSVAKKKSTKRKSSAAATGAKVIVPMKKKKPAAKTKSGDLIRQRKAGSGLVRQQKHLSARGKRNQARRDSKSR